MHLHRQCRVPNLAVPREMGMVGIHFDDRANDLPRLIDELLERGVLLGDAPWTTALRQHAMGPQLADNRGKRSSKSGAFVDARPSG